jgi:transcriptional regulator CtsR
MGWKSAPSDLTRQAKDRYSELEGYSIEYRTGQGETQVRVKKPEKKVTSNWENDFTDAVKQLVGDL